MTNEEARDQIVIFMCDEQKVINDRDKQALDMAIKALETIPKYKDAYNKGYEAGVKATNVDCGVVWEERIEDIKAEIQEHTQRYTLARESGGMGQVDWSDYLIKADDVIKIIDKHCGGDNE